MRRTSGRPAHGRAAAARRRRSSQHRVAHFQRAGQVDIHEHRVAGTARLVGKQLSGAAQPPGAQRWLAAHEEHPGQVNRLHRRPVHVPLLEVVPM